MAQIRLKNVGLQFQLRQRGKISLKEYVVNGMCFRSRAGGTIVKALHEVNLQINEGERVGIIGRNGAGKSSLLKLLAGIYLPTSGHRLVRGKVASLFDITLGFEQEASGWENIAFRSYLQGETPRTLRPKLEAIAEFSELGEFLEMPVRYYSAGMLVRLAFSVATAIEPEILIVDEVLSAGDFVFQQKARQRIQELVANARLAVIVSHDMNSLAKLCDRIVWIDHGRVQLVGPSQQVIDAYENAGKDVLSAAA